MLSNLRTNEDIVGLHLWASQIRKQIGLEMSREYRSDAVLWDVFETYCPNTSNMLLPPPRRHEEDEKQFSVYVVSPPPGQQYYGRKGFQIQFLIRAARDIEQATTCVCVDLEGRLPFEVDEENVGHHLKTSCFPWSVLSTISNIELNHFCEKYVDGQCASHDEWRLGELTWDFEDVKQGFFTLSAYVTNCESTVLSDVAFSSWTSHFTDFYRTYQSAKCRQYELKSIFEDNHDHVLDSDSKSIIIEATYRIENNETRTVTYVVGFFYYRVAKV